MSGMQYEDFIRSRITELRMKKGVSEHKMSLELDKSGSYVRGITNGTALPSLKEMFNIITYFEMTPNEFFAPLEDTSSLYHILCNRLRDVDESELVKVDTFLDWIL